MDKQPHWSLSKDKTRLQLDIPSEPPARFNLAAEEADDLIAALIALRSEMEPQVPDADPERGARIQVTTKGRWYLDMQPGGRALALLLLHPGTRWIGMTMDRGSAEKMLEVLTRLLPQIK